jgi:hypothetical protein
MGCPRPKYFFFSLPNLLPQKIRLPLISFFYGVSYNLGKLHLGKLHKLPLISFFSRVSYIWGSYIWGSSTGNG